MPQQYNSTDPDRPSGTAERPANPVAAAPRVFVVDDDEANRILASANLRRLGWQPEPHPDGLSALQAARQSLPSAMLVDLRMPRMNGVDLVMTLRREFPDASLRLVAYTAHAQSEHQAPLIAAGFDAVLTKPVLFAALQAALPAPGSASRASPVSAGSTRDLP